MTLIFYDIGLGSCIRMRMQGVFRLTSYKEHRMSTIYEPSEAWIDRSFPILNAKLPT